MPRRPTAISAPRSLGEGTDFTRYLAALCAGQVIFDPGSKVMNASTEKSSVKARSQFRIPVKHLEGLYQKFGPVNFEFCKSQQWQHQP
ncbi:MAG: hypothetical protein ABL892_02755 [Thiobacillaceae bacterium]